MTLRSQHGDIIVSVKDNFTIMIESSISSIRYDIFLYTYSNTESGCIYLGSFDEEEKAVKVFDEIYEAHRLNDDYWIPKSDEM